ncbi:hypothetical protein GWI33_018255 [Rhynchophorus ferrugineus]|uniref:Uncharacterized protein n=1 Tax=Rhynchophorus ferrugineus TaxID=354439 RepID=A0A834I7P2_RHYFE|nr:hypothetical protein GWI33_018255 [Rhynchophorus ferrugineus]
MNVGPRGCIKSTNSDWCRNLPRARGPLNPVAVDKRIWSLVNFLRRILLLRPGPVVKRFRQPGTDPGPRSKNAAVEVGVIKRQKNIRIALLINYGGRPVLLTSTFGPHSLKIDT